MRTIGWLFQLGLKKKYHGKKEFAGGDESIHVCFCSLQYLLALMLCCLKKPYMQKELQGGPSRFVN
jgi:hypothetical protein